jgi:hypothetical protein
MRESPSQTGLQKPVPTPDVLSSIDTLTTDDIADFRELLKPEFREIFDEENPNTQLTLVALHRTGYEYLVSLTRGESRTSLVGVHDLRDRISFLLEGVPDLEKRWKEERGKSH